MLQNNTIGTIMTSAILHDSDEILVQNNHIASIAFQALESVTYNFTMAGNTIGNLALMSLSVKNATNLIVTHNSFQHIERFGLAWIRSRKEKSSLVFTHNHIYGHDVSSLIFIFKTPGENLVIGNNTLHFRSCDCTALHVLVNMTRGDINDRVVYKQGQQTFSIFKETSVCSDEHGNESSLTSLCQESKAAEAWMLPLILIVTLMVIGLVVARLLQRFCRGRHRRTLRQKDQEEHFIIDEWDD